MSGRDAVALVLVVVGVSAAAVGGFIWCLAAGFIILGVLLTFLGVLVSAGAATAPPRMPS